MPAARKVVLRSRGAGRDNAPGAALDHGLQVRDLGLIDYQECLALQRRLVQERIDSKIPDTLLLCEHPDVITLGRGFRKTSLKPNTPPAITVIEAERGGDVTYHGPGQLVGYPIIHLKEREFKIGDYIRLLERMLIEVLEGFGLQGYALKNFTGVWVKDRKVASIGVAARSWVAFHGFALNVSTDLSKFQLIHPCGLESDQMTSIEKLTGAKQDFQRSKKLMRDAFARI